MNFAVVCGGEVIGYSDLEHADLGMSIVHGAFRPTPAYEAVRRVFRLFSEDRLKEYYVARDGLSLEIVNSAGALVPTDTVHIVDYSVEAGDEAYELEVILQDASTWREKKARV